MTVLNDFILAFEKRLPDFSTSKQLVELGLFSSEATISRSRKTGTGPSYIQVSTGKILYPKRSVLQFVRERWVEGSSGVYPRREL